MHPDLHDPERENGRVDNVRYLDGAPEAWAAWLRPGDRVSLVSLGGGVAVENSSGRGFLPLKTLQRIDLDDPAAPHRQRSPDYDWGKWPGGLMNIGSLWAIPRRPMGSLRITSDDRAVEFDVSERTWPDELLVTAEAEASLERCDESLIRLDDGTWRWIKIKRFHLPDGAPNVATDALGILLGHPAYWDSYLGGPGRVHPHLHGPYRLETISIDTFRTCDAESAMATLQAWLDEEWLDQDGHPVRDDQIDRELDEVYRLMEDADTCFQLPDLGEEAWHVSGFILDKPFIELVIVGPADRLTLIVATGD